MTLDEFAKLPLVYRFGINRADGASRLYRNDEHGFQMEIHTPKTKHGGWGKERRFFYLDNDDGEYRTVEELYAAFCRRHAQDGGGDATP